MTLLVVVLACLLRRWLDSEDRLPTDPLWRHWLGRNGGPEANSTPWAALITGVSVAVVTGFAVVWLKASGQMLLAGFIECLVLLLAMGVTGWRKALKEYSDAWGRGDMQASWRHVKHLLRGRDAGLANSPESLHLALSRQLMVSVFERYFLILFWFLVIGPAGALLARLLVALKDHWPDDRLRQRLNILYEVMAWLPVRLVGGTFGMAGDLQGWARGGWHLLTQARLPVRKLLLKTANVSLSSHALDPAGFVRLHPDQWTDFGARSLAAVRGLLNRSLMIWVAMIALLAIIGVLP